MSKKKEDKKDKGEKKGLIHPQVKKAIALICLLVLFVLSVLSLKGSAGLLGEKMNWGLGQLFGQLKWLFPVFLLWAAVLFFRRPLLKNIGLSLVGLSLLGLLQIFQIDAGLVGWAASYPLLTYTSPGASITLFSGLMLIGLLVVLNVPFWEKIQNQKARIKNLVPNLTVFKRKEKAQPADEQVDVEPETKTSSDKNKTGRKKSKTSKSTKSKSKSKSTSWQTPSLKLLEGEKGSSVSSGDIKQNKKIIARTLENFGITVQMGKVKQGPTVTQYTLRPDQGVKLSKITALQSDLSLALAAHPLRIEAPIPGKSLVGLEVPNEQNSLVRLKDLLKDKKLKKLRQQGGLHLALGRDVAGEAVYADLCKMPHLLIAGATGSGKTICINALILSLLYQYSPEELKMILVDPKRVELSIYNGLPHLLNPIITKHEKAVEALKWAIEEMEDRFDTLEETKSRDIGSYNKGRKKKMPYIVIIIDELADLMASEGRKVEGAIVRLAQMARAVGIHLIVSTQRPSVEVITGLIKANITSRVAFQVASQVDSRTILDTGGAQNLLGNGDMLFLSGQSKGAKRVQGALVTQKEAKEVVGSLSKKEEDSSEESIVNKPKKKIQIKGRQQKKPSSSSTSNKEEKSKTTLEKNDMEVEIPEDELSEEAKKIVVQAGRGSASLLQRRLSVGYARAARLLDILEAEGVIGPHQGSKAREVLIDAEALD